MSDEFQTSKQSVVHSLDVVSNKLIRKMTPRMILQSALLQFSIQLFLSFGFALSMCQNQNEYSLHLHFKVNVVCDFEFDLILDKMKSFVIFFSLLSNGSNEICGKITIAEAKRN